MAAPVDIRCTRILRPHADAGRGFVTLYLPDWRLSLLGCRWSAHAVRLPQCVWTDRQGREHRTEALQFADSAAAGQFTETALAAIRRLVAQSDKDRSS